MDAVRGVDDDLCRSLRPLVDSGWAEVLAGVPELARAALYADRGVDDKEVTGLILFVLGA